MKDKLFDEKTEPKKSSEDIRKEYNQNGYTVRAAELDDIETENEIESADMQSEAAQITPDEQQKKQDEALAKLDPEIQLMQQKMKRQQAATAMIIQTTSAMDWQKFGGMHCMKANACKRTLAMIGLQLKPEEPEKIWPEESEAFEKLKQLSSKLPEHKEEIESIMALIQPSGHYAYTMKGTVTLPAGKDGIPKEPMLITAYMSTKIPFFSRKDGADILPENISEENIRQACISKWYRNALDCATGLQKIPEDAMYAMLGRIKTAKVAKIEPEKWGKGKQLTDLEKAEIKANELRETGVKR